MIRAMIFDLDGTLLRTEMLKARSYAQAALRLRPELTLQAVMDGFKEVVGLSRREVALRLVERFGLEDGAAALMPRYGVTTPWQAYLQLRLAIYEGLVADDRVLLDHRWPHAMELLARARSMVRGVGLATMSHCRQVRRILAVLDLEATFDFVATRDDVEHGKPHPEIYLLVARELGELPEHCLVVEDSPTGVQAALQAGMACVAVSNPFTRESLRTSGLLDSRWIVDDPQRLLEVVRDRIHEASENGHEDRNDRAGQDGGEHGGASPGRGTLGGGV